MSGCEKPLIIEISEGRRNQKIGLVTVLIGLAIFISADESVIEFSRYDILIGFFLMMAGLAVLIFKGRKLLHSEEIFLRLCDIRSRYQELLLTSEPEKLESHKKLVEECRKLYKKIDSCSRGISKASYSSINQSTTEILYDFKQIFATVLFPLIKQVKVKSGKVEEYLENYASTFLDGNILQVNDLNSRFSDEFGDMRIKKIPTELEKSIFDIRIITNIINPLREIYEKRNIVVGFPVNTLIIYFMLQVIIYVSNFFISVSIPIVEQIKLVLPISGLITAAQIYSKGN